MVETRSSVLCPSPIAHHTGFTPNACVTGNIRHACLVTAVCVVGRDWIRVANMRLFDVLFCRVGSGKGLEGRVPDGLARL